MQMRLAYLTVTQVFAVVRLLPVSDRDKDAEILALRHQITVLQRQLGKEGAVHPGRSSVLGDVAVPAAGGGAAQGEVAGASGYGAALAPRSGRTLRRCRFPAEALGKTAGLLA
ncbi:hypothetical protein ACFYSJ_30890 [Streptomyces sp. NPDC005248]|uniref:hypothetical protein n=1 Tax=Streptomyces sp. NPDC005248 TaxID=3364709 RepID=UPI00367A821A